MEINFTESAIKRINELFEQNGISDKNIFIDLHRSQNHVEFNLYDVSTEEALAFSDYKIDREDFSIYYHPELKEKGTLLVDFKGIKEHNTVKFVFTFR